MKLSDVIVSFLQRPKDKDAVCPHTDALRHIERMSKEADKLLAPVENKASVQNL